MCNSTWPGSLQPGKIRYRQGQAWETQGGHGCHMPRRRHQGDPADSLVSGLQARLKNKLL